MLRRNRDSLDQRNFINKTDEPETAENTHVVMQSSPPSVIG